MQLFTSGKKRADEESRVNSLDAIVTALNRSQAVIEFDLDGKILTANKNFLDTLGYSLVEVQGHHHSLFVDPAYAQSHEYREFWRTLNSGQYLASKYRRVGKGGREVWIQASYNPVFDKAGKAIKVIKFAIDVTAVENERKANEQQRQQLSAEQAGVVAELGHNLTRVADGDLQARITNMPGEYKAIETDFNAALAKLDDAVAVISGSGESIRGGSSEISVATGDLSKRTEQQAASLEQTAAALDEITATVKTTAAAATNARDVVTKAKLEAERSGTVVERAVAAMSEINRSSSAISQIIGVIDEIAFQTNLLALNAGVEAARAGEAGRGFAVVASEVRALAQRSADAATEIKALISTSSTQVASGVELVDEAGRALGRITTQVDEINGIVGAIAASAQEQATALQQVNTAVNQMDQMTQQNAAMVEETTAASQSLASEAEQMAELIGQFRFTGKAHAVAPVRSGGRSVSRPKAIARSEIRRPSTPARTSGNLALKAQPVEEGWEEF